MKSVCLVPLLIGLAAAASLPSYIKPCKRGAKLNQCAVVNGNAAIPSFVKGDAKLKIATLEPVHIKELSIKENSAKSVALNLTFIDMKIKNLSTGKLVDSNIDLNKRHIEFTVNVPKVVFDSQYTINGRILVLPIRGNGPCHIELDTVKLLYVLDYKMNKVKGVDHAVITNTDLGFEAKKMKVKLDNLFNGDKALGDNMNIVLNDNWEELLSQLGPPIAKAIALAVKPIVDKIVSQVPFDQIFPK
uniref:Protein takeout n=1 Tax=Lygus hesperus TaxID=30085 RepID=A0A0A9YXY9_LYGHE